MLFDHLSTLYAPGTLLCSMDDDTHGQVVEVVSCEESTSSTSVNHWSIHYWHFRWNGEALVRIGSRFQVEHYTGVRQIVDLPFRPLLTASDPETSLTNAERIYEQNTFAVRRLASLSLPSTGRYPLFMCNVEQNNQASSQRLEAS